MTRVLPSHASTQLGLMFRSKINDTKSYLFGVWAVRLAVKSFQFDVGASRFEPGRGGRAEEEGIGVYYESSTMNLTSLIFG